MVVYLFFTMPQVCLPFVIVVFCGHTHLLLLKEVMLHIKLKGM